MYHDGTLPPDDVLAERLRRGDDDAFELILDAWSPAMLRLARSFVSCGASAEEVVQDAWLAVVRGIGGFQGRASLHTWVFRILVNTAKKRGICDRRLVPLGSMLDEESSVAPSWPGRAPQRWSEPETAAQDAEIRRVIRQAISELPYRSRAVLLLRDMEGYSSQEVCALLDISPGNQRVILHRTRVLVRGRLAAYFAEDHSATVIHTIASAMPSPSG